MNEEDVYEIERCKTKIKRLMDLKEKEPNNTYHDWNAEILHYKEYIADVIMEYEGMEKRSEIKKCNETEGKSTPQVLKPCPFCGGKAYLISTSKRGGNSGDMGTSSTVLCLDGCECGAKIVKWGLEKEWAEESAIKAWNRRA